MSISLLLLNNLVVILILIVLSFPNFEFKVFFNGKAHKYFYIHTDHRETSSYKKKRINLRLRWNIANINTRTCRGLLINMIIKV
jgi:hypothetical protein